MSLREYITSILQHTDIHCFFQLTSGHQFGDNKEMVFSMADPIKFHQILMLEFPMHNIHGQCLELPCNIYLYCILHNCYKLIVVWKTAIL